MKLEKEMDEIREMIRELKEINEENEKMLTQMVKNMGVIEDA